MIVLLFISVLFNIVFLSFLLFREKQGIREKAECSGKKPGQGEPANGGDGGARNTLDIEALLSELRVLMEAENDTKKLGDILLSQIAKNTNAVKGALYVLQPEKHKQIFQFQNGYAFYCPDSKPIEFELGEGLIGQVAKDKKTMSLGNVPVEHSVVISGLGQTKTQFLFVCPVVKNDQTIAVLEFSFFSPISPETGQFIGKALNLHKW